MCVYVKLRACISIYVRVCGGVCIRMCSCDGGMRCVYECQTTECSTAGADGRRVQSCIGLRCTGGIEQVCLELAIYCWVHINKLTQRRWCIQYIYL